MNNIGVIILAGGKGKRMGSKDVNKVALMLAGKPMIRHVVERLVAMTLSPIIVVVGFAKESVQKSLDGLSVLFVEQFEQLGTAHAVSCALKVLPKTALDVLVIQGDDSAFYKETVFKNLLLLHAKSGASVTFLTLDMENSEGLGRIVRDNKGNVVKIVEEKDATKKERQIKEVNPACYIFRTDFLKQYISKIDKSTVTGEYYLTSIIDIALNIGEKVETLRAGRIRWRGVNTMDELQEAEELLTA